MSGRRRNGGYVALELGLATASVPFVASAVYLGVLAAAAKRPGHSPPGDAHHHLTIVIPARNERAGLPATISSLQSASYPPQRRRIVVVADNCDDDTAAVAAASGAEVLVRDDPTKVGKGHALALAFSTLLKDPETDVLMVVDADTVVSPNVLTAISGRISAGAKAVQVGYGVNNPDVSWRTELMTLAFACVHDVRSLARERFGLSTGLHGNGMAFTRAALEAAPYEAYSLTEDVEYGIDLALAGIRVCYVAEAGVYAQMPANGAEGKSQRQRWERGRAQLRQAKVGPLTRRAFRARDRVAADVVAELLVRPLANLAASLTAGLVISRVASRAWKTSSFSTGMWLTGLLALGAYVGRGWQVSAIGWRGLSALAHVPSYVMWKIRLRLRYAQKVEGTQWIRTPRTGE